LIEVISLSISERHPVIGEKVLVGIRLQGIMVLKGVLEQIRLKRESLKKFYGSSFGSEILLTDC